jgi:hypothetical protein
MNRTKKLKLQLGKLCQETPLQWDQLLPIALLGIRSSTTNQVGLSPFQVLYRCPPPLSQGYSRGSQRNRQPHLETTNASPQVDSLKNQ